ncbi:MAG: hypothetical protein HYV14_13530 [Elusimicrobia bacterium]|nr:hypothetical protein [Elusimicrobiota bacterium]
MRWQTNHMTKEIEVGILAQEIHDVRDKILVRYRLTNYTLYLLLAGALAGGTLLDRKPLSWMILFVPPCLVLIAAFAILQLAYTQNLTNYVKAKSRKLNSLLGSDLVDYEVHYAGSRKFVRYTYIPIFIIWGTWLVFYGCSLFQAHQLLGANGDWWSYLSVNLLLFLLHIIGCYRIIFKLPFVVYEANEK